MELIALALVAATLYLFVTIFFGQKKFSDSIPRVKGALPWFGNALQVKGPLQLALVEWGKQYGGIFAMKLFGQDIIVVSSEEAMKEGLVTSSTDFAGRPDIWRVLFVNDGKGQFGFGDTSPNFVKRKKIVMTILRRHIKELKKLESISVDTVLSLVDTFRSFRGKPFDPRDHVNRAVSNILLSLLFGHSLSDEEIARFTELDNLMGTVATGAETIIFDIAPWTRFFLRDRFKKLNKFRNDWNKWMTGLIDERKELMVDNSSECIVDSILQEINKTPDEEGTFVMTEADVFPIIRDLIIAGTDTSSSTMNAALAVLAVNPECQKIIQKELDDHHYGDQEPRLDGRESLHYTEAFLLELLRYTTIAPLMLPHKTQVDTSLCNHKISKDTTVWFNIFALHHDEKSYSDPYTFKPERFLDQDGILVPADHHSRAQMYAFGAGRRICPGADLAKNRLFLLITWLLKNFTFLPPEGVQINADPRDFRMTSLPNHINRYKIRAIPRL